MTAPVRRRGECLLMLRDAGLTRTGLAVDRIVDIVEEVVTIEDGRRVRDIKVR